MTDDELCPSCSGTGYAYERLNGGVPGDYSEREVSCSRCRGTGLFRFKPVERHEPMPRGIDLAIAEIERREQSRIQR